MNQLPKKKVPMRQCCLTLEHFPKQELLRVVRTPEGNVCVDVTGKVRGHGVYLCKNADVISQAKKKHSLDRKLEVKVPDSIYDELLALVK